MYFSYTMKEEFLHFVWQQKLIAYKKLQTTADDELIVIKTGDYNLNEGPDFLNAHLKIGNQEWFGNVEIHLKSSDWYVHQHEKDSNYDAVILHVVWEHDVEVYTSDNLPLPTLVLKDLIDKNLMLTYQQLMQNQFDIPCANQSKNMDDFTLQNWLERLYFDRLEEKSVSIQHYLQQNSADFEAALFVFLAKNFGLNINGTTFYNLATSFDFKIFQKNCNDILKLEALLFGQSGFLNDELVEPYFEQLKKEYGFLKHKFQLEPITKKEFQFFKIRPQNFPTIRLAQLAMLYHQHQFLFSKLLESKTLNDFYKLFSVGVSGFWKEHYTFTSTSKKSSKKLSKTMIQLLLINTIIPLLFVYYKQKGLSNFEHLFLLLQEIKSEKNAITKAFDKANIKPKNALESQALLTLQKNYCAKKRCLDCAIGVKILKKT